VLCLCYKCIEAPSATLFIALIISTISRGAVKINVSCYMIKFVFFLPWPPPPSWKWFTSAWVPAIASISCIPGILTTNLFGLYIVCRVLHFRKTAKDWIFSLGQHCHDLNDGFSNCTKFNKITKFFCPDDTTCNSEYKWCSSLDNCLIFESLEIMQVTWPLSLHIIAARPIFRFAARLRH